MVEYLVEEVREVVEWIVIDVHGYVFCYFVGVSKWLVAACEHSPCFLLEVFAFFCALDELIAILKRRQRV